MQIKELFEAHRGQLVYNLRNGGNRGDALINQSVTELFASHGVHVEDLWFPENVSGDVLFVNGCGNFCAAHNHMVRLVKFYENRFKKIYILPASFEASYPLVNEFLTDLRNDVVIYCRERFSYDQVAAIRGPEQLFLDSDMAFYFDWSKIDRKGKKGVLHAFRVDKEKNSAVRIPDGNRDISVDPKWRHNWRVFDMCKLLGRRANAKIRAILERQRCYDFVNEIMEYDEIYTDRAHVAIGGAMLGKKVYLYQNNYHKIKGIYENSMADMPNVRLM